MVVGAAIRTSGRGGDCDADDAGRRGLGGMLRPAVLVV